MENTCEPIDPLAVVKVTPPKPQEPFLPCKAGGDSLQMHDLLPPDHPLLRRFQQSLREHLLRVKNQLSEEIDEIKFQIKLKEEEREEYGAKLYDKQHEINRQNEILEEYSKNIHETVSKRIEEERLRDDLRKEYDEKFELNKERKYQYNQRLVELGHLQNLETNVRNWTNNFELELVSSKRVMGKDAQLQRAIAEEKQKADLMFFNLQVEVKKREEELDGLKNQIGEQTKLNNILHTSLSDANADLEVLQTEHKRLTQAWGEVVVAISHRDKVLFQAKQTLEKQQEALKLTISSIEATKKQIQKEIEKNDKLEAFKARLLRDLITLKRDTEKQKKILTKLELKMEELPKILERTEKDHSEAISEGHHLNIQLNNLQYKLEKEYAIKTGIEDNILRIAQDQLMCDKASKYRLKVLTDLQESRRTMEENLHKVEYNLSNMLLKLERQKATILHLHEEGDIIGGVLSDLNKEYDEINQEIKKTENQMSMKLKQVDRMSKILDDAIKESEGCEISPTERKIKNTEKAIMSTEQKIKENQQYWLIQMGHIVNITNKRNHQLNEIQVARKQLMIINQKSLKINTEIEKTEHNAREIDREIQNFSTKLELVSNKGYQKKREHENNEFECEMEHFELLDKLKESEMRVLQLEQETVDLTSDIEQQKQIVLEHHREALSWETKYKLIDETLNWRRNERAIESEIGTMRAEIHRMQIRHSELKRAQEKLVQDLDHCVMHRERIFVTASTKQKMEGQHFKSRTNVQQKINDVKNKLKQVNCELSAAERKLGELITEHAELEEANDNSKNEIGLEANTDKLIANEIEQGILLKHQNLESIVRKQNRAKQYRRLTGGATSLPRITKSETSLELNMQKQLEMNSDLVEVVEGLLAEFPEKKFILTRLLQTLKD